MNPAGELQQWAAQLGHAVTGAGGISSAVVASGNVQAKTGVALNVPGPALASVLARRTGRARRGVDGVNPARLPGIADHMAADALHRGVNLLKGT